MTTTNLIDTLMRYGIGYDTFSRFPEVLNSSNYPPHNIEKLSEDRYRLTLAVAGFKKAEITLNLHQGMLTIEGKRTAGAEETGTQVLYRGIGLRDFNRQFKLGEHVHVTAANLDDGLLVIDLERQVPEELQPKLIQIS